jgi:hypothetical protein
MEDKNYKTALSVLIQSIKAGTKYHEYSLEVGMTPPVLLGIGVPQLPLTISVKMIDKCYFDHGISEARLRRLYDLIASPKSVFKSDSPHLDLAKVNPVVVITVEVKDENPILIAVHPNQMVGRRAVNLIKSIYDKPEDMLQKWRGKGLLLWDAPASPAPAVPGTVTPIKPAAPVVAVKKTRQITNN